jgi:thymidylate kinase
MSLIYITGPSGSGKSTVTEELLVRGYEAHDADQAICSWYDNETGEQVEYLRDTVARPADWQDKHSFLISEVLLDKLKGASKGDRVFICGIAPNDLKLAPKYFDTVICLMIDEQTMVSRVTTRKNNKYGQSPDQLAVMRKWYRPTVEKYHNFGVVVVDATQPAETVVDEILAITSTPWVM